MTTDDHLGHHQRNTDQGDAEQVEQHKGAATVHTGDIGEFPDVAQPHSRTGRCHDESKPTGPTPAQGRRTMMMVSHKHLR